jgi:O-methyltransferase
MGSTDLSLLLERVRPFTMVPDDALTDLARQVRAVLSCDIPGDFVECGVWRGGASFLMADLLRQAGVNDRKVWLFDSFEGLPSPQEIDGPRALAYARDTDRPWYLDNCRASVEEVRESAMMLGLGDHVKLVKGWFDATLPANRDRIGPIAILRIDGDWYASVRSCLEHLYDGVVEGGFVILDDYYTFDGCAIAVHEFLGRRQLSHRIESVTGDRPPADHYRAAVFRKGKATWRFLQQVVMARDEIAAVVPRGAAFILVDQGWFDTELVTERRVVPFLERDGHYWGAPPDDAVAIRELNRLRQSGAAFLIILWPAFWWLDYYSEFRRHLRSKFQCVLENDRLIVFDLREDQRRAAG